MTPTLPLDGIKVLVVEDELLIALDLSRMIQTLGGEVLGPVSSVAAAAELLSKSAAHGAVMDIRLGTESSAPLAEDLLSRGVPVILTTGYADEMLPQTLANTPKLTKPYTRNGFEELAKTHFARS